MKREIEVKIKKDPVAMRCTYLRRATSYMQSCIEMSDREEAQHVINRAQGMLSEIERTYLPAKVR